MRRRPLAVALTGLLAIPLALAASAQESIDWQPCGLEAGEADRSAECARVPMPRFHDRDSDATIEIAVKRVVRGPDAAGSVRQLWFLNGGPGDSGVEAIGRLAAIFEHLPLDIYTLDHRGVGGSELLECPDQMEASSESGREITGDEWVGCIEYLRTERDDLDALTATQASHDLARLIDMAKPAGAQVTVFGASYGTYWANRYLQLYPDQPDAVILDGLVPADWTMAEFDAGLAATATGLLQECARQPVCREHLGPDPVTLAAELPGRVDAGHCSMLGIDGDTVRLLLGNMLMGGEEVWPYIAPMIHRLDRCRWRDLLAIGDLFASLFEEGGAGEEPESHSQVLQRHVSLSELWPEPAPSPEQLRQVVEAAPMTTDVSAGFAEQYADWPRYPRESLFGRWADYTGPALLLHGSRDPTMPVARLAQMRDHYDAPGQSFVLVPDAGHVVINSGECVRSIYAAFLMSPGDPIDASCLSDRAPLSLDALPEGASSHFRTDDLWGDRLSEIEILILLVGLFTVAAIALTVRWIRRRRARRVAA